MEVPLAALLEITFAVCFATCPALRALHVLAPWSRACKVKRGLAALFVPVMCPWHRSAITLALAVTGQQCARNALGHGGPWRGQDAGQGRGGRTGKHLPADPFPVPRVCSAALTQGDSASSQELSPQ